MFTLQIGDKGTTFYAHTQTYFNIFSIFYKFRQFFHINRAEFLPKSGKTQIRLL